MLITQFQF